MPTDNEQEPKAPVGITIGKVIGIAGMVLGAVALGAAVLGYMQWLPTSATNPSAAVGSIGEWFSQNIEALKNEGFGFFTGGQHVGASAAIAGVLGGGGFLLNSAMNNKKEDIEQDHDLKQTSGNFAAAEETRAIQGLMKARLTMADPSYFQGMPAGRSA